MPLHRETRIVPYTAEQMYAVVAEIDRYPEFLPWCSAIRITGQEKAGDVEFVTARMDVSYLAFRESYVSRVKLDHPALMIEATHIEGPFKKLDTRWRFEPTKKHGSEVHFLIDFSFSNPLFQAVAGAAFGLVAARMQQAFITRADALYGESHVASSNS
ncbi:MAG TPA: type II toxin-antitoxin system RatA family toxin [Micropepsaceae bacterium]|nr:type II toxin-antitoxin system RatA family toxin [Micropepsaceae bacterium]